MQKQEKEMIVTHMSNVNVANNYMCSKNSMLNSQIHQQYCQPQCR